MTVYYTDEFSNPGWGEYQSLKGLPLEYEMMDKGIRMRMTAKKISEEPIDATYFNVPDGYTEMNTSDLQKMMGL